MKRPSLEAARHSVTGGPMFRFVCSECEIEGAWHPSLNDAELAGARHARVKHREVVRA